MRIEELAALVSPEPVIAPGEALAELENVAGYALPEDYRSFLQISGGGGKLRLSDLEYVEFRKGKSTYFPQVFCRLSGSGYHSVRPLSTHLTDIEKEVDGVPDGIFTIADDGAGNFLTIDLRPKALGHIGVVDHETVGGSFDDPETYDVIAESFSSFVQRCRMKREARVMIVGDGAPVEILNASEVGPHLLDASRRNAAARLCDDSGAWVEFQPVRGGGFVYKKYLGSSATWQSYYDRTGSSRARPFKRLLLGFDPMVIEIQDATTLFEGFLNHASADLDILWKQLDMPA